MTDRKISELTNITGANLADADEFVVVDSSASETKAITYGELKKFTGTITSDGLTVDGQAIIQTGVGTSLLTLKNTDSSISGGEAISLDMVYGDTANSTSWRTLSRFAGTQYQLLCNIDNAGYVTRMALNENGDISFYEDTGTTPKFFWDASAEALGIGTTSPTAPLQVDATSAGAASAALHLRNASDTASTEVRAYFTPNTSTALNRSAYVGAVSTTAGNDSQLVFGTNASGASPAERMRINSNGNVGIGTTSPAVQLQVTGTGNSDIAVQSGDSSTASILFGDSTDVSRGRVKYINASDAMTFEVNNLSEAMRIDSSGRLLLGQTTNGSGFALQLQGSGGSAGDVSLTSDASKAELQSFNSKPLYINRQGNDVILNSGSGNVGIGTSSPVSISGYTITTLNNSGSGSALYLQQAAATKGRVITTANELTVDTTAAIPLVFGTNSTERMRIDSSGNLLVGTTTTTVGLGNSIEGVNLRAEGRVFVSADSDYPLNLSRNTSDGDIAVFRKDGTTVGSIGVASSAIHLGNQDTGIRFAGGSDAIQPWNTGTNAGRDAAIDLGTSTGRFKDLYLSGGVYLGGTGAANYLDDYEEGTWTPSLSANTAITYTNRVGQYTKVGNLVVAKCYITLSAWTGAAVSTSITGLPFTAGSSTATYGANALLIDNLTSDQNAVLTQISPNSTESIILANPGRTGAHGALIGTQISASSTVRATIIYQTA